MQPVVTSPPSKKKGKYDITFKLKVIQWAEKHSNRAAGSKFGLNESTIRGWRKSAVANSLEAISEISSRGVMTLPPKTNKIVLGSEQQQQQHHSQTINHQQQNHQQTQQQQNNISNRGSNTFVVRSGGRPVSPPRSLALDERDLARLSCSPSDDGYYDEVCYQEEVVDSPPPTPPLLLTQQHHHHQQHLNNSNNHFDHSESSSQSDLHELQPLNGHYNQNSNSNSHLLHQQNQLINNQQQQLAQQHVLLNNQQLNHQPDKSHVRKTISHQVTSKPFPEIQLPFTVIVYKSVRDHWLQSFAEKRESPETDPELDMFARTLGLERR